MGLDMYLTKRIYVKNWDFTPEDKKHKITISGPKAKFIDASSIKEIVCDAGYWRKANQIHNWFVENIQGGNDNCEDYWVSIDKLEELYKIVCEVLSKSELYETIIQNGSAIDPETNQFVPIMESGKAIKDPSVAEQLLPSASGFFFGSTSYDEWYYQDLELTKEILEKIINDPNKEEWVYYYRSSW